MRNLKETRLQGIERLNEVSQTPVLDVDLLLCHVLCCTKIDLILRDAEELSEEALENFEALLVRRLKQEPIAYICGEKEFMGLTFFISHHVLIPRPDTEILVEAVLELIPRNERLELLDIGTGSGAILISLLNEREHCRGTGVDISPGALQVAQRNARTLSVEERAEFVLSDLFAELEGRLYDFIISNPPYIDSDDMKCLEPNVSDYEPHLALFGGTDGLDYYRRIIRSAPMHLKKDGCIGFEIGYDQRIAVTDLLVQEGFEDIRGYKDLAGHDRAITARLKPNRG